MTRKDKNRADSFNNPFSRLKGLSVSSQQKASVEKRQSTIAEPPEPLPEVPPESTDAGEQFSQAMGQLGVQRTRQDDLLEKSVPVLPADSLTTTPAQPSAGEQTQAGSRRQVRKAARRMGVPEATLDLHGVAAAEVIGKVEWFLENAVFHGCRFVRIVTGKGTHSSNGPVLRPMVESYLSGPGRKFVAAWVQAPGNQGGAGALLAELYAPEDVSV